MTFKDNDIGQELLEENRRKMSLKALSRYLSMHVILFRFSRVTILLKSLIISNIEIQAKDLLQLKGGGVGTVMEQV